MAALRDISQRYAQRVRAEQYRDRFLGGRRRRTHLREAAGLRAALDRAGPLDTLLDVGSGPGRFVSILSPRARRFVQADCSKHMLDLSRTDAVAENGDYVQADARCLPFRSGSFDLVLCHRVLNHVARRDERRRMLSELMRVTRGYVLTSCLGPPRVVRLVRESWRRLTGRVSRHAQVHMEELLSDAAAVGLILAASVPIRMLFRTAVFMIFRIK